MSSEVWLAGEKYCNEVDTRRGEVCQVCPTLNKQRAVLDPADPTRVLAMVHICNDCGISIPEYPNMGRNGYQSFTVDHLHLVEMGVTHPGRKVINRRLCRECMAKDYQKAYPNVALPAGLR